MTEKLLSLLNQNARMTDGQLAVMLGQTEEEVTAARQKMEKAGIIRAYKAVVDWEKTQRQLVTAIIELRVTPRKDSGFEELAQTISRFPEVESLYLMSGGYDFAVHLNGASFQEVAMFVAKRLAPLDSVLSTATHFVLRRYKENHVSFLPKERDERGVV